MKCVACHKRVAGPAKIECKRVGIQCGSTRYAVKKVAWCLDCWTAQVELVQTWKWEADKKFREQLAAMGLEN